MLSEWQNQIPLYGVRKIEDLGEVILDFIKNSISSLAGKNSLTYIKVP
jgi:hypothetical protein